MVNKPLNTKHNGDISVKHRPHTTKETHEQMITEGFRARASVNKKMYDFIKKLMAFDKTYESFVRSSYSGRYGLRGLNNCYKQLKPIFNNNTTTQTYEIFKRTQQHFHSSNSVQVSQHDLQVCSVGQCEISKDSDKQELQELRPSNRTECSFTASSFSEVGGSINEERNNGTSTPSDRQCGMSIEREEGEFGHNTSKAEAIRLRAELEQRAIERDRELKELAREIAQGKRDVEQGKRDVEQGKRDVEQGKRDIEALDARNKASRAAADRELLAKQIETYNRLMIGQLKTWVYYSSVEEALSCGKPMDAIAEVYRYLSNKPRKKFSKRDNHTWNLITDWYARNRVEKVKLPSVGYDNDNDYTTIDV